MSAKETSESSECKYCGGQHEWINTKCPAYAKSCRKCGKYNHFQFVCQQTQPTVHQLNEDSDPEESLYYVEWVGTVQHHNKKQFFVPLRFRDESGETVVQCQLDTGATCNVMSFTDLCEIKQHGDPAIQPTTAKLRFYDNSLVEAIGECNLCCHYKGEQHLLNFKIVSGSQKPLLSGETCTNMELIIVNVVNNVNSPSTTTSEDIIEEYKHVFQGLGCLPEEYHLEVDPNVTLVKHTPRRVAIPLKAELHKHIEELENMQVLKKVPEPTDWISSEVVVGKGNKLRLCIDPKKNINAGNMKYWKVYKAST